MSISQFVFIVNDVNIHEKFDRLKNLDLIINYIEKIVQLNKLTDNAKYCMSMTYNKQSNNESIILLTCLTNESDPEKK